MLDIKIKLREFIMSAINQNLQTLTGAKIVLETLRTLGVNTIFGYPGGIVLSVYDELFKQNDIKHYLVRHEQAAIHAAEGYSRVSGKCGVALVTSGPGATNIVTGLANAYLDGYPVVVLTGQVSADLIGKDAFQEVNIIDITKSCTKKNFQVTKVEDLEAILVEAFHTAVSGKQGPVVVDLAKNIFSETCEFIPKAEYSVDKVCPDDLSIGTALNAVCSAERPVIVAGGGVIQSGAEKEILSFAKLLNIPVVNTMMGLGTYPQYEENYLGMIGLFGSPSANQLLRESDLIFAVGARFNDRIRCCFPKGELARKLVHLDINENEISRIIPAAIPVVGDAKYVLNKMIEEFLSGRYSVNKINNLKWIEKVKELKEKKPVYSKKSDLMHSFEVMDVINKYVKDPIITTEVGQHQVWASRIFSFNKPRKFITSGGSGTMGFGFPASIGACVANDFQPVICVTGDGSLQMNIQELMTCVDYNLPVKIFIMNNGYLGMVRQLQEKLCGGRYSQTQISNPDFIKIAEAYGIKALRVFEAEQIIPALEETFAHNGPVIVDFVIEPMEIL